MSSFNWPPGGSGGGGGVVTGAANVGTGVGVFQVLSGTTLNFRSVTDGTGITWVQNANDIQGTVSLAPFSTTNLAEGTNLYYTQARFDTAFAAKSTTNLAEGTNLYYTQARFDTAFAAKSTTNLAEGTNLYYTQARFDTAFAAKDTDDLAEGVTNLYYTDARARASVSGSAPVSYNSGTGVFSMHVADATHDGYLSQTDFVTFSNASQFATPAQSGIVSTAAQSFGGLKKFEGGLIDVAEVDTITASTTLTNADRRYQTVEGAALVNITLPTTGVKAGEIWTFVNSAAFPVYLFASDATALDSTIVGVNGSVTAGKVEQTGKITVVPLIDTPVTNTDWRVVEVIEQGTYTTSISGQFASATTMEYHRVNNSVDVSGTFDTNSLAATTNTNGNFTAVHPTNWVASDDIIGTALIASSTAAKGFLAAVLAVVRAAANTASVSYYNADSTASSYTIYVMATYKLVGY